MKIAVITPIEQKIKSMLEELGQVTYVPHFNKEQLAILLDNGIDVIFTNPNQQYFKLDSELLLGSQVKIICTASTGLNHIDMRHCEEQGIKVLSITRDSNTIEKISSTAEHSFALMMALLRNIPSAFDSVKKGEWSWEPFVGRQMNFMTVGIVGYGRLGRMMIKYCKAFDAKVMVCDPYQEAPNQSDLKTLFDESDIVSLHVHVKDDTRHMVNDELLDNIKSPVYLVNTSRGEIVDERAVIRALENGTLLGYATDVLEDEFGNIQNSELTKREDLNIIVTPHIAGMTREARNIAYTASVEKLRDRK